MMDRHIAIDHIGAVRIATVQLPLDPVLFETRVSGGALDGRITRYNRRPEADKGHTAMVQRVRQSLYGSAVGD